MNTIGSSSERTKALGWKTPSEVLEKAQERAWLWLEEDAKKYNSWLVYMPLMSCQFTLFQFETVSIAKRVDPVGKNLD